MKNWINELSDNELTELFKFIFDFKLDEIYLVERDGNRVTFNEKWGNGTKKYPYEYLETHYWFEDNGFSLASGDVHVGIYIQRRLWDWMIKRFGKPYISDLLHYHTGIKVNLE